MLRIENVGMSMSQPLALIENVQKAILSLNKGRGRQEEEMASVFTEGCCSGEQRDTEVL